MRYFIFTLLSSSMIHDLLSLYNQCCCVVEDSCLLVSYSVCIYILFMTVEFEIGRKT